jgi:malate dehydrogenase (quinone)
MSEKITTDVLLVGGGIMSATLGMLLTKIAPTLRIVMAEALDDVAQESSYGWNNAGTGHAGYCELNYTPRQPDGSIPINRALGINAAFEVSLQFWTSLVEQHVLPAAPAFINRTPHLSFVWGEEDVAFLRQRHSLLSAHPLFSAMEYSEDAEVLRRWIPLIMHSRNASQPLAATRVAHGADVDFGALTRHLVTSLQQRPLFDLLPGHPVQQLRQDSDGNWHMELLDRHSGERKSIAAGFVFLGAGGGALSLLQKSDIPEGKGYGGFPVSGQWLVCNNPDVIRQHHAKVYGQAPLGAPPMSVPHLDTRIIDGKPALLFGPFAGFTTKFLRRGSYLDLLASVRTDNLKPMLAAGLHNRDLTRYLMGEAFQTHSGRMQALRNFIPDAKAQDWSLAFAGKRVQIIKRDADKGGKLEFGTELVAAADGSLAALLGASPGASVSVTAMIQVIERCLAGRLLASNWQASLKELVPSYGESLINDAALLQRVRQRTLATLGLQLQA